MTLFRHRTCTYLHGRTDRFLVSVSNGQVAALCLGLLSLGFGFEHVTSATTDLGSRVDVARRSSAACGCEPSSPAWWRGRGRRRPPPRTPTTRGPPYTGCSSAGNCIWQRASVMRTAARATGRDGPSRSEPGRDGHVTMRCSKTR